MAAKLVALVVPLGLDTFAVAAALGMMGVGSRSRLRISVLLLAFGLYTIFGDEREEQQLAELAQMRSPGGLLLGISVSLDELAIGFTLGLLRLAVALVIALIALQAFTVTQLGLRLA